MKRIVLACFLMALSLVCMAQARSFDEALALYNRGLYSQADDILRTSDGYGNDPAIDGYSVLCALKMRTAGCEMLAGNYLMRYSSSALCGDIHLQLGHLYFDEGDYDRALKEFALVNMRVVPRKERAEFLFRKGYCLDKSGADVEAGRYFDEVLLLGENDYSGPARYFKAYRYYTKGDCASAQPLFEQAAGDERFTAISNYYIALCRYDAKDYDYLLGEGLKMYTENLVPEDRKAHLARLISEAYLIRGDKLSARKYFGVSDDGSAKTRSDYFYAGSLFFMTGEWSSAVENLSNVTAEADSVSQAAWYQMGQAYVSLKNKVSALDAYKQASSMNFDQKIKEDAFFNYAKLAFDVNGDTSVFSDYILNYSDRVRGEKIYSYMALASLTGKDYQTAIDFYDKIEELSGVDKDNYVRANYLKGAELMKGGSYRKAANCFQAVSYYSPRETPVNQLARYNMAGSYYCDGQYDKSSDAYIDLYNASALYGLPQSRRLGYDAAYSLMRKGDYAAAAKWFSRYVSDDPEGQFVKDAMLRKADCLFVENDYKAAAEAYDEVLYKWSDVNDIYPYYQSALCYGLLKNNNRKLELLSKVNGADVSSPYYAEALFELAKVQQTLKKKSDAEKTLTRLVSELPGTAYAARSTLELGTLKRGEGKVDAALSYYKQVVKMQGGEDFVDDALLGIESIYQSQGQPSKYIAYLESIGRGTALTPQQKEEMVFSAAERQYLSEDFSSALVSLDDFVRSYPSSAFVSKADYYVAGCYLAQGDKLKACDAYGRSMNNEGLSEDLRLTAMQKNAELNYSLENFAASYDVWKALYGRNVVQSVRDKAVMGMVSSAYAQRDYQAVVDAAVALDSVQVASVADKRSASMMKARSLISLSRREEAVAVLTVLSSEPNTAEGAEACYLLAQDAFDRGEFEDVKTKVQAFGQSGTNFVYWLAKSFILLGDAYNEQGNSSQARATWQSVRDGYEGNEADIVGALNEKLGNSADNQ